MVMSPWPSSRLIIPPICCSHLELVVGREQRDEATLVERVPPGAGLGDGAAQALDQSLRIGIDAAQALVDEAEESAPAATARR